MLTAFQKLEKILRLEESQGYRDRAVIGGFSKFAGVWQSEAQADARNAEQEQVVSEIADMLISYGETEVERRMQMVDEILRRLQGRPEPEVEQRWPPAVKPGSIQSMTGEPAPATQQPEALTIPPPPEHRETGLDAPVTSLPGVSTAYAARLARLGISTVGDLLHHYPHRYDDYTALKSISQLQFGEEATVVGTIWETRTRSTRSGGSLITSVIADASGTVEAVWFNQPFLVKQLRAGRRIVLSGKIDEHLGRLRLQSPAWEPLEKELIHTGRLVPVYPLTSGITSRWLRKLIKRVVDYWTPRLQDHLPDAVRARAGLVDLSRAVREIHFPDSQESAADARRRLSFDEFFFIQLGMLHRRQRWQQQAAAPLAKNEALLSSFLASLPFALTEAQQRSMEQILADLARAEPMSRLLQGDVGSGKTVVATAAALMAVAQGKQVALMAPTEILAEQHHRTVQDLLAGMGEGDLGRPVSVELLTGSVSRSERSRIYASLASGGVDIIVGTQALIQRHLNFDDLALVIVDEQHRFGVLQRGTLRSKGGSPHMLVMSATPIPRSLALTLYGDLEISVIDELPPGRQPIVTRWLLPRERERAYAFVLSQIEKGRQAFVLYPLIQESDKIEARAAVEEYERLRQSIFPRLRLGLLHGRMKTREKDEIMTRFRAAEIDILVSTSVIEVGIDVPNATVMLIEGADRFGLAQLHQFRGRVGRGAHQSYCLLLSDRASPDDPDTKQTWERLKAIEDTQDGFALAEKDLELRGPGDFFGVRQSGLPALRLASLSNVRVLEEARAEALALYDRDPVLEQPEHRPLAEQVARFWQEKGELS